MRIDTPTLKPRESGEYKIWHAGGYGDPNGEIILDEEGKLRLTRLDEDDCDRLIKAAVEIKTRLIAYRAEMAVPHGRRHLHKGTCQLCGKSEDDALHAEHPKPEPVLEGTVVTRGEHPYPADAAAILADSIATGQSVIITEDEPVPAVTR